jgi:hypothetical protein
MTFSRTPAVSEAFDHTSVSITPINPTQQGPTINDWNLDGLNNILVFYNINQTSISALTNKLCTKPDQLAP